MASAIHDLSENNVLFWDMALAGIEETLGYHLVFIQCQPEPYPRSGHYFM